MLLGVCFCLRNVVGMDCRGITCYRPLPVHPVEQTYTSSDRLIRKGFLEDFLGDFYPTGNTSLVDEVFCFFPEPSDGTLHCSTTSPFQISSMRILTFLTL